MSLSPLVSQLVLWSIVGLSLLAGGLMRVSGRASRAEEEITADELAIALNRNRYPAKTIVKTVCRVCHHQIDRHYIDFKPDLGAVHIVDGLHLRCRRGGSIEIDLEEFASSDDLARHLRTLEGAPLGGAA